MPILWFRGPGVTAHNGAYVVSRAAIGKNLSPRRSAVVPGVATSDESDIASREQQTPEGLAAFQKAEIEKWWPIIKAAGIKTE